MGTGDKKPADKRGGGDTRAQRMAEALRENLKKRKALTRARSAPGAGGSKPSGEPATPGKGNESA